MVDPGTPLTSEGTGDVGASSPGPSGGGFKTWPTQKKALAIGGGIGGLVIVYLFAKSRKASTAAAANTTNSSATTPTLVMPSSNQDSVSGSNYAALEGGLNGLSNQVSQLSSQESTEPTTSVSQPGPPSGVKPPNVPPAILSAIPGQTVVAEQWDPSSKGWLALSNKGGIFSLNQSGQSGPGFYGSPLGDPGTDGWVGPNGQWQRTAAQLTVRPSGGYTITDTAGENYSYGPG